MSRESRLAGDLDPPGAEDGVDAEGDEAESNDAQEEGAGEPYEPGNLPYFRPSANVARGQASKIVSNAFSPNCAIAAHMTW